MILRTLEELGVEGRRVDEKDASGVWVDDRKVASIGVRCARWVTTHGFSLNLDLDLDVYRTFDACGLGGAPFTTVSKELGRTVPVAEALRRSSPAASARCSRSSSRNPPAVA